MKAQTNYRVSVGYGEAGALEMHGLGTWRGPASSEEEAKDKAMEALWDNRLNSASCSPRFTVQPMKKFKVSYRLTYDHVVSFGIEADSHDEAIEKAQQAFDDGRIWDNTPEMPLLYDEYEEHDDNVLEFTAEDVVGNQFVVEASANTVLMHRNAVAACHALLDGNPEDAKRLARKAFGL